MFVRAAGAFLGALILGALVGFAVLLFVPCNWFGSSFEGACGFGAVNTALASGVIGSCLAFGFLLWFIFRRKLDVSAQPQIAAPGWLFKTWVVTLVLQYVSAPLLTFAPIFFSVGSMTFRVISSLLLSCFIAASWLLAPFRARHPALSLIALIPFLGPLVVAVLLFAPASTAPDDA